MNNIENALRNFLKGIDVGSFDQLTNHYIERPGKNLFSIDQSGIYDFEGAVSFLHSDGSAKELVEE